MYVSDAGKSHQVKVFTPGGKFVRAIGHPGAPHAGPYDTLHFNHPQGITVDSQGRLWVTENDFQPKRVSVWDPKTGKLLQAFYGPPAYGGGGELDPQGHEPLAVQRHGVRAGPRRRGPATPPTSSTGPVRGDQKTAR